MWKFIDYGANSRHWLYRPDHDESGKYKYFAEFCNKAALEQNQRIRNAELMKRGQKLSVMDNSEVRFAFSIPSYAEYSIFLKRYPEIDKGLHSRDQKDFTKAAREMSILKPEWVVSS